MSRIINQNTEPLFIFDMPDDETLSETISVKGEKGEKGDPTKLSELENDTGYVTAATSSLTNYYSKTATDSLLDGKLDKATFNAYDIPSDFFTGDATVSGSGSNITLQKTAYAKIKDIIFNGSETTQDGTPSPSNPIAISATSGAQTVVISGDLPSETYQIDLGDIVLRKIGAYKDYIYKKADGWYLHKEITSVTLDGSENWTQNNSIKAHYTTDITDYAISDNVPMAVSFKGVSNVAGMSNVPENSVCFIAQSGLTTPRFYIRYPELFATVASLKTWLEENPTTFYYALAAATEDKITDAVLIKQLDAVLSAHTYLDSTTIAVTGSLPMAISVDAFANGWSGSVDGINAELDDRYTKAQVDAIVGDKVRFIFPKFWDGAGSGDCGLIKYGTKNILIDCYTSAMWTNVKAMLDDNDAPHLDYFILTHYHADHYGNLQNLIDNGYIDADTVLLMSAETTTFGTDYNTRQATVLGWLDDADLSYRVPDENEVLYIDGLKLTFVNCDKDILDAYTTKDANSCSTCILIEHGNTKSLYVGDAGEAVFIRLRDLGFPDSNVSLYKISHHGINTSTDSKFIRNLSPVYAVQTSGIAEATVNQYGNSGDMAVLSALGSKIYQTHMQSDYIELVSDGSAIQCVTGTPYGASAQSVKVTYYVDKSASVNAIQDGSQEHPFSEIMQALAAIPYNSVTEVGINLADGYYGNYGSTEYSTLENEKNRVTIRGGKNVKITIRGNSSDRTAVVLKGVWIQYSNVILQDLTVDLSIWDGIIAYGSYVETNNVAISMVTEPSTTPKSGILLRETSSMVVTGGGLRIEKCNACIRAQSGSKFLATTTVEIGEHASDIVEVSDSSVVITGGHFVFDNSADKLAFKKYDIPVKTPVQIMSPHNAYAESITLLQSVSNYSWVDISYHTSDNIYGTTGKIYAPNNKKVGIIVPKVSSGTVYNRQCHFEISGTSISITNKKEVRMTSGNAPVVSDLGTVFNVDAVIAGFDDYVDLNS